MSGRAGRKPSTPRGLAGPKAEEDDLARAAGRRRARRLHLGRARPAARGRPARDRGDHRRQRRLDERRRAARRLARGRPGGRARAAAQVLEAGQPRRACCRRCSARSSTSSSASGAPTARRRSSGSTPGRSAASPYEFNPLDINPLRDALNELIDFDARPRLHRGEAVRRRDQRLDRQDPRLQRRRA